MNLTSVQIENFRGIRNMNLELGKTTVLIGENNTGKTSVLDALKLCLENMTGPHRTVFDPMDFHLPDENAEPSSADPIKITLTGSSIILVKRLVFGLHLDRGQVLRDGSRLRWRGVFYFGSRGYRL